MRRIPVRSYLKFCSGCRAFTLSELLVSSTIYLVIFLAFNLALWTTNRSWSKYQNITLILNQGNNALYRMSQDLRMGTNISITQSLGNSRIDYQLSGVGYYYVWTNSGSDANKILRVGSGVTQTIIDNVSSLLFTQQSQFILISLTTSRNGHSFSLASRIAPRT